MEYKYQLGFIGAGNMAKAIVHGIIENNLINESNIIMSAAHEGSYLNVSIIKDNQFIIDNCKYVVFAVKPQIFDQIVNTLDNVNNAAIISIMAGKSASKISNSLNTTSKVIRVMPNTPCMIGKGMIVIANNNANKEDNQFVSSIFNSIGKTLYLDEELFDAMTSVSGSGPAYVYYFIKAMVDGGVQGGLDYKTSLDLVLQTIIGSVDMVKSSKDSLSDLIEKVCSKGGTTIQAINTFNNYNMVDIIKEGMLKCKTRSEELSK